MSEETRSGIYRIVNARTGCEYIGSAVDIKARWRQHRHDLRRGQHDNRRLQRAWTREGENGFRFEVLERVPSTDLLVREQAHLDVKAPRGRYNVLQVAGSCLGLRHTAESRAKMSAALRGRQLSDEHRAALSAVRRGRVVSESTRAKISAAKKGRPRSPDHAERLRAALTGRRLSEEHRARISDGLSGHVVGAETRAKLAAAGARRRHSAETREKMRNSALRRGLPDIFAA